MNSILQKPLIVHIIDSLSVGGAEILLKNSLLLLREYRHIIIYLDKPDDLKSAFSEMENVDLICLHHKHRWQIPFTSLKLRKIINRKKPVLVHSHLFNSTMLARISVPSKIPVVSTIHSIYSLDAFRKNRKALWFEKMTVRKKHYVIAVSNYVLQDYLNCIPFKGKTFILYNFLPSVFFAGEYKRRENKKGFQCIAVGNLKKVKNYDYLLQVFEKLKEEDISLDIYGTGELKEIYEDQTKQKNLRINFKGKTDDIKQIIPDYDLFIQASEHEGFGMSVIEAMALKVPVLVSDIPVFREITNGHAHFFQLSNPEMAVTQIKELANNKNSLFAHMEKAYQFTKEKFNEQIFLNNLGKIYQQIRFSQEE